MPHYQPKRIRPLRILAMLVHFVARLVKLWPLLLIVVAICSPITPMLRWDYRYHDIGGERVMSGCRYLGIRGFSRPGMSECPIITLARHEPLFTTL